MNTVLGSRLAPAIVIGSGMIAQRFSKYVCQNDIVLFASGVSNSKEVHPAPYIRERALLESTLAKVSGQLFVYFSTASVNDPMEQDTPYIQHKLAIEELISSRIPNYLIIRASNVVGGLGNRHTVLNYFWEHIQQGKPFAVWQYATRNLIDLDDLYRAVERALICSSYQNQILTLVNPCSVKPLQIVRAIETYTGRRAIYEQVNKGIPFDVHTHIGQLLDVEESYWQPDQYMHRLLQKYYL